MRSTLVAAFLLAAAFAPVAPAVGTDAAFVPGDASFAVRADLPAGSAYDIQLIATGPATSSQVSLGAFFLDEAGGIIFGFAFTAHGSPDRLVLQPVATVGNAAADGVPEIAVDANDGAGLDGACPFACLTMTGAPSENEVLTVVAWAGGVSSTRLVLAGSPGVDFAFTEGTAWALGDAELQDGANVQYQESAATPNGPQRVGVKAMRDASVTVQAADPVYGFWGLADFKTACVFSAGVCTWPAGTAAAVCARDLGTSCRSAALSVDTPDGARTGAGLYDFVGATPGAYTFRVDHKVDAYGPRVFNGATGLFAFAGENHSYLTAASVRLP